MRRGLSYLVSVATALVLLVPVGCGSDNSEQEEMATARAAALAELHASKRALDAKREELAELETILMAPEATEPAEGEEAVDLEEVKAREVTLRAEVETATDAFGGEIVAFINEDAPVAGEPVSEALTAAVDMKVDEDILLAQEWVQVGGDYKRAISILEQVLPLAPEHPRLLEEIENAKAFRYMTEERLAAVENGQSEDEVREVLGPVNLRNVREYPDKGVFAWFYPKDGGGAAGVYFRKKGKSHVVYKTDFEAVKVQEPAS